MLEEFKVYKYMYVRLGNVLSYLSLFIHSSSFQPVLHDWCKKGCGLYNPVCGMMHIKEPLLLIGTSSLCGSSGFPLLLSVWSFTIIMSDTI